MSDFFQVIVAVVVLVLLVLCVRVFVTTQRHHNEIDRIFKKYEHPSNVTGVWKFTSYEPMFFHRRKVTLKFDRNCSFELSIEGENCAPMKMKNVDLVTLWVEAEDNEGERVESLKISCDETK